jgi:hypothetical protein
MPHHRLVRSFRPQKYTSTCHISVALVIKRRTHLLLLVRACLLRLRRTSELLATILSLLALLSASLLDLGSRTDSHLSVMGLEFLHCFC